MKNILFILLMLALSVPAHAGQLIPFVTTNGGYWSAIVVTDPVGECPTVTIRDQFGFEVERHFLMSPGQTIIEVPDDVTGWVEVECETCRAIAVMGDENGITTVGGR